VRAALGNKGIPVSKKAVSLSRFQTNDFMSSDVNQLYEKITKIRLEKEHPEVVEKISADGSKQQTYTDDIAKKIAKLDPIEKIQFKFDPDF